MTEYKRLTKRFTGGSPYTEYASNYDILLRLAELEDKIENGTLVELPCKVGDTVYYETFIKGESKGIVPHKVIDFVMEVVTQNVDGFGGTSIPIRYFGKDIFLTKAEAEAKLKESEDGNGKDD